MQPTAAYCHCGERLSYLADGGHGCRRCEPGLPPGREAEGEVPSLPRPPLSSRYLERLRRSRRARARRKAEGG